MVRNGTVGAIEGADLHITMAAPDCCWLGSRRHVLVITQLEPPLQAGDRVRVVVDEGSLARALWLCLLPVFVVLFGTLIALRYDASFLWVVVPAGWLWLSSWRVDPPSLQIVPLLLKTEQESHER